MSDDRFDRALSESEASRLISDARGEREALRNRKVLEAWANSIRKGLDSAMEGYASFGVGHGELKIDYDGDFGATLRYTRQGSALRMNVVANAYLDSTDQFRAGLLVGDEFENNSAIMEVEIHILDTDETLNDQFRYGLQPVSKLTSIDKEQFLSLLERLIRRQPI